MIKRIFMKTFLVLLIQGIDGKICGSYYRIRRLFRVPCDDIGEILRC
jgi:hypothetical protein